MDNSTILNDDTEQQPEPEPMDETTLEPETVEPGYYEDYWWHELPPEIQDAASECSAIFTMGHELA